MISPKANLEENEDQEGSWRPYQRPGILGIDYDEYGAEMAPNARVWKRYVEESDKTDKELVGEWNSMLDIILIFAALFSAISTAFVIESSKDLKPDYTERSAQTLLVASQTLLAISRGSPVNESTVISPEMPDFTPPRSAIIVNTLWFLSLSLSVAVSLVAILAKNWCSSFMGGRFGSMLRQGRLRQQRWDGIRQWKVEEILNTLPLLMHVALQPRSFGLYLSPGSQYYLEPVLETVSGSKNADLESVSSSGPGAASFSFHVKMASTKSGVYYWANTKFREMFSRVRFSYKDMEQETPMDLITSSMLRWMIETCQDPKSIDIAVQALAGADMELPRRPLWECGAAELLCERLRTCSDPLKYTYTTKPQSAQSLLDNASLFSRSLGFITTLVRGEGLDSRKPGCSRFLVQGAPGSAQKLELDTGFMDLWVRFSLGDLLDFSWTQSSPRYEIAAYEFNNLPAEGSKDMWEWLNRGDQWCSRQRRVIKLVAAGQVPNLPPSALLAMVGGMTKTFLYEPLESPIPLLELLYWIPFPHQNSLQMRSAIGVGLAISALASGTYLGKGGMASDKSIRLNQAMQAYQELITPEFISWHTCDTPLVFGLLSLLTQRTDCDWTLDIAHVHGIKKSTGPYFLLNSVSYHQMTSVIPPSFDLGCHLAQLITECLASFGQEPDSGSVSESPALLRLDIALDRSLVGFSGDFVIIPLVDGFMGITSLELKRVCLRGIQFSVSRCSSDVCDYMLQTGFLEQLLGFIESSTEGLVLHGMAVLWNASIASARIASELEQSDNSACSSILQLLANEFTIQCVGSPPANTSDLGLADLWLPKLVGMCQCHHQSVLDSEILREMMDFYYDDKYSSTTPRTTQLPSPFDSTWTWVKIIQELQSGCVNTAVLPAERSKSPVQGTYFDPTTSKDQGAEKNGGFEPSLYWAM